MIVPLSGGRRWLALVAAAVGIGVILQVFLIPPAMKNRLADSGFEHLPAAWTIEGGTAATVAHPRIDGGHAASLTLPYDGNLYQEVGALGAPGRFTASIWVIRRLGEGRVALQVRDVTNSATLAERSVPRLPGWHRIAATFSAGGKRSDVRIRLVSNADRPVRLVVDGSRLERGRKAGADVAPSSWGWTDGRVLLLLAIAVVLLVPLVLRVRRQRFDVLEPLVWLNAAFLLMFVLRPVALLLYDDLYYRGRFDISSTFDYALLAGLAAAASLLVGYSAPFLPTLARRLPALPCRTSPRRAVPIAAALFVLGFGLYLVYLHQSGIGYGSILSGANLQSAHSTAYLYYGPFLAIPSLLMFFMESLKTRRRPAVVLVVVAALVVTLWLGTSGNRLWMMLVFASFAIYPMLRTGWRPHAGWLVAAAVLAFFVVVPLRDVTPQSGLAAPARAIRSAVTHPGDAVRSFMTGADTEMFDALASEMKYVPHQLAFRPGSTFTALAAQGVPRLVWPGKPRQPEDIVNEHLIGDLGYVGGQAGPAYSVLGGLYFDSGYVGIVVGLLVTGLLFRLLWEYLRATPDGEAGHLVYAAALPFSLVLMRGGWVDTATRAVFVVLPLVLALALARRRNRTSSSPADVAEIAGTDIPAG